MKRNFKSKVKVTLSRNSKKRNKNFRNRLMSINWKWSKLSKMIIKSRGRCWPSLLSLISKKLYLSNELIISKIHWNKLKTNSLLIKENTLNSKQVITVSSKKKNYHSNKNLTALKLNTKTTMKRSIDKNKWSKNSKKKSEVSKNKIYCYKTDRILQEFRIHLSIKN